MSLSYNVNQLKNFIYMIFKLVNIKKVKYFYRS